jgi:hypothetical protein
MSIFAKVENGIVTDINVADQEYIDALPNKELWVETAIDGSIRKNYACIGFTYDQNRDAFIGLQPYPSWVLNESTCVWEAPTPQPQNVGDIVYAWDEDTRQWIEGIHNF